MSKKSSTTITMPSDNTAIVTGVTTTAASLPRAIFSVTIISGTMVVSEEERSKTSTVVLSNTNSS